MYRPPRILITALLVILLTGLRVLAQPIAPTVTRMGNGLTVILLEDHTTELVGVDVWVKAGSSNETKENNGVSHFIEHLVFGATSTRESGDMDLEMESMGATLNAHTSKDWAHFDTTVSSRYLARALNVLADALMGAAFKEQDIARERLVLLDEIASKQADPVGVCKDMLAAELYGKHPYALPVEGTSGTIKSITRQQIIDYYNKLYTPANMAVVLAGDIDVQRAVQQVGQAFQGKSGTPRPATPIADITPVSQQVNKSLKAPLKSTYLAVGFHGPPGSDYQDVCATDALLAYLGFGYQSWMETELKGKMGLASAAVADFLTQRQPGAISLVAEVSESNLDKAKGALFAKIAAVRADGIPESSLALAKRSLLGQYAFQNETCSGMATSCGFYFAVSEPEFASKYVSCVQSIGNQDIIRVAQKYLDPARAVVLVIGPNQGGAR